MKNTVFLLFILIGLTNCKTSKKKTAKDLNSNRVITCTTTKTSSFPKGWVGHWQGELEIYGVNKINMNVKMSLDIKQKTASIYNWTLTYNLKNKKDIRAY